MQNLMMMMHHKFKPPSNQDRLLKQRAHEDEIRDRISSVHSYDRLMRCAEFEVSNEPKASYRTLAEKLKAIRETREAGILERRAKVSGLLGCEETGLEEEMKHHRVGSRATNRRDWLESEARRMRSERLGRERDFVDAQLERAFRDGSDDVRVHTSKQAVLRAEAARRGQRATNLQTKARREETERAAHEKMEMERARREEEAREDSGKQNARKREAIDILRDQVVLVRKLHEEERAAVEHDMAALNQRWRREEEDLKKQQHEKRCAEGRKAREMLLYNEQNRAKKAAAAREEKRYDAHMIAMVSEREAEEERQEALLREAQRREAKAYADQLRAAVELQRCEDDELESIIKAEVEESWRKQDEHTKKQDDSRKALLDQVHQGRQDQIHFKEFLLKDQEEQKRAEFEKDQADTMLAKLEDERKVEQARLSKQEVKDYLQAQMRHKKAEEHVIQQNKRADFEDTKVAESKYEARVNKTLTDLPHREPYYGRKAVKWYE